MQVRKPLEFAVFPTLVLVAARSSASRSTSASTRLVLRDGVRRPRDRRLRPHRDRRLPGHRPGRLRDPRDHPAHRGHQRCRPRRRGRRPLHPRRDARQADGHRRRPQRRSDRRGRGTPPPQGGRRRGRLLRRDGRWHQVRQGRRDGRDHHHLREPDRRLRDRHAAARHVAGESINTLQPALRRRRPGLADPRAADVRRDRRHRHPLDQRGRRRQRPARPVRPATARRCRSAAAPRSASASIPGMPKLPFLVVGALVLLVSTRAGSLPGRRRRASARSTAAAGRASPPAPPAGPGGARPQITDSLRVDPLELLLAPDLVDLVDAARGGDLLDRVRALRRKTALDLGIVLPPVRTRDGATLPPGSYEIRVGGVSVATGEAPPGHLLAIGDGLDSLPGRRTTEPVFGLPAVWVPAEHRASAEVLGATLVERAAVVTTHLAEMVRQHASRLLSLDDVRELLDVLKAERPADCRGARPRPAAALGGAAGAAGPARRAGVDPRPRPGARGRRPAGAGHHGPGRAARGGSRGLGPALTRPVHAGRRPARDHARPGDRVPSSPTSCAAASRASSSPSTRCSASGS